MLVETLEELTYDCEEDGVLVRKQLERVVLAPGRGAWAVVMFLFQELDVRTGTYRAPKMALVRFKKAGDAYRKHSAFNVSNEAQARQIAAVLADWSDKARALGSDQQDDAQEMTEEP